MSRGKISPDARLAVAKACAEGELSQSEAARRIGVNRTNVREWIALYKEKGAAAFEKTDSNPKYSVEVKLQAVKEYLEGKGSLREIAARYPLFHSDRGFQYTNRTFHNMLEAAGMQQSMSRIARCIDNGPMEGFWGILKRELYYGKRFADRESLVSMIEDYIDYYNTKRLQRKLGILTPMEKHEQYLLAA